MTSLSSKPKTPKTKRRMGALFLSIFDLLYFACSFVSNKLFAKICYNYFMDRISNTYLDLIHYGILRTILKYIWKHTGIVALST